VQVFQADRFGAQEAVRKNVARVSADAHHALLLDIDFEPAAGFAEGADSVRGGRLLGHGIAFWKSNGRAIVSIRATTVNRNLTAAVMLVGNKTPQEKSCEQVQ
jgi:hypothetical protein